MSSAGLHAASDIITYLTSDWVAANTDNKTPNIVNALEVPWQSLDFGMTDILYVKNLNEAIQTGMWAQEFYHRILCTVEVMSAKLAGLAHFTNLVDETMRIIKANSRLSGYAHCAISSSTPRYVKDRGIYTCTIEIKPFKVLTS